MKESSTQWKISTLFWLALLGGSTTSSKKSLLRGVNAVDTHWFPRGLAKEAFLFALFLETAVGVTKFLPHMTKKQSDQDQEVRLAIAAVYGPQHCFVNDEGYMLCNYVVRDGEPIFPKLREYMRWKVKKWKRKPKQKSGALTPDSRTKQRDAA